MQRGRISLWLCFVLAFVVATGIAWFALRPQKPIGERVTLNDGTELTLHAITFGKEHNAILGKPWEIMLDRVPEKFLPQWKPIQDWRARLWKGQLTFPEDKLVVWFAVRILTNALVQQGVPLGSRPPGRFGGGIASAGGPPALARYGNSVNGIPWRIVGPKGSELGGMIQPSQARLLPGMATVPRGPVKLYPVVIDSYPRRLREITFKLYQPIGPDSAPGSEVAAKEFVIKNPKATEAPRWNAEVLPIRRDAEGLTCVLTEWNVVPQNPTEVSSPPSPPLTFSPNLPPEAAQRSAELRSASALRNYYTVGSSAHSRIVFELFQNSAPTTGWTVQTLTILDPTGNVVIGGERPNRSGSSGGGFSSSSASAGWSTRISSTSANGVANFLSSRSDGNQFTCLTTPLWLDEPAWKIQVDLVQTGNFPTKNSVRLEGIPFPPEPRTQQLVREIELFGWPVKIHSVGASEPDAAARTLLQPNSLITPTPPTPSTPYPSLVFEFDANGSFAQMVKVAEVKDNTGQRVPTSGLRPDFRRNMRDNWRLDFMDPSLRGMVPNLPGRPRREIKSIDITLALPEQRTFEFTVKPTWVNAEERTNEPAKNR